MRYFTIALLVLLELSPLNSSQQTSFSANIGALYDKSSCGGKQATALEFDIYGKAELTDGSGSANFSLLSVAPEDLEYDGDSGYPLQVTPMECSIRFSAEDTRLSYLTYENGEKSKNYLFARMYPVQADQVFSISFKVVFDGSVVFITDLISGKEISMFQVDLSLNKFANNLKYMYISGDWTPTKIKNRYYCKE